MDEKGANTFPFHNIPPELKKTTLKVFPVLFHLSFWIKEKSVATLAKPQHLQTQTQKPQVSSPTVSQIAMSKIVTMILGYQRFRLKYNK